MLCCTVKEVAAVIRRDWKSSKTPNETSPMELLAKGKWEVLCVCVCVSNTQIMWEYIQTIGSINGLRCLKWWAKFIWPSAAVTSYSLQCFCCNFWISQLWKSHPLFSLDLGMMTQTANMKQQPFTADISRNCQKWFSVLCSSRVLWGGLVLSAVNNGTCFTIAVILIRITLFFCKITNISCMVVSKAS